MNVYDFDHTVYDGDSTIDFYKFCISKKPILLFYLLFQLNSLFLYILGIYDKTKFKEKFFVFLRSIEDIDALLCEFWKKNKSKIAPWYLEEKKNTDVIISASPEFLLKPIVSELGVRLIASVVCKRDGKYSGQNCYGKEKLNRFRKEYPLDSIENFYSDSASDRYLAELAYTSYIIKNGKKRPWNNTHQKK